MRFPRRIDTGEPSAINADDAGAARNGTYASPYNLPTSQSNAYSADGQTRQRGCSTWYSKLEPSRCAV